MCETAIGFPRIRASAPAILMQGIFYPSKAIIQGRIVVNATTVLRAFKPNTTLFGYASFLAVNAAGEPTTRSAPAWVGSNVSTNSP